MFPNLHGFLHVAQIDPKLMVVATNTPLMPGSVLPKAERDEVGRGGRERVLSKSLW